MKPSSTIALDQLVRASTRLAQERRPLRLIAVLVEQALDVTAANIAAAYLYREDGSESELGLAYRRGHGEVPGAIEGSGALPSFLRECGESVVVGTPEEHVFPDIFLVPGMQSGIGLPLATATSHFGMLVLNSRSASFFNRDRFSFLDSFAKIAGSMLQSAKLNDRLRAQLRETAILERYQENVFSSMTNLLVTTDSAGTIRYANAAARDRLRLEEGSIGAKLEEVFAGKLDKSVLRAISTALEKNREFLGIEGIFTPENARGVDSTRAGRSPGGPAHGGGAPDGPGHDGAAPDGSRQSECAIDFSLNVSPLRTRRGALDGLTLLFTDQSAERNLKGRYEVVVEERRVIKDMFSRYLSEDLVQTVVQHPERVKPGGDKKNATVFFGDIRGYTAFSENQQPEYIIEVLNEYFREAVEVIVRHRGFIDKFIGDAIMAAWGVPMESEGHDAVEAVSAALEIQEMVKSARRTFFRGRASGLKVGIGLHTGPLVAGNLGSARRLNYSVIGDTVNVAARLESVAKGGQVIITEDTRKRLDDHFRLKDLEPVKVKGKAQPIRVFQVISRLR